MRSSLPRRLLAEIAGTTLLVGIGTGAIVAAANAGGSFPGAMPLAWFVAVALPVGLFARVSGAHLNPAVSLALTVSGRAAPRELPGYVAAQVTGAFLASAVVRASLGPAAHLGATVPAPGIGLDVIPLEFGFTAMLLAAVFYLETRPEGPSPLQLLLPAAVVGLSTWTIGPWTGSSLNPARSIAPAVLSGDFDGFALYLTAAVAAAVTVAILVRVLGRDAPPTAVSDVPSPTRA